MGNKQLNKRKKSQKRRLIRFLKTMKPTKRKRLNQSLKQDEPPDVDLHMRRKWLTIIQREDLLQREELKRSSHLVCSAHFEDSSIKIVKHLKTDALPSMDLPNQPQERSSRQEAQSTSARVKGKLIILSNDIIKEASCSSGVQSAPTSDKGKHKGELILLSNNKEYVNVGTQMESLRSMEEQTQTSKSITEGTPPKRKLSNELWECELKQQKLNQEITKIEELEAKNQPITCDPDDRHGLTRPRKLSVLCKNVIKKYNLIESKKQFGEPSSSTVVGGKPLRDRKKIAAETVSSIASTSSQPPKKPKVDKDGVTLSQTGKKRGRPRKLHLEVEVDRKKRGRPRKEPFPDISVSIAEVNPEVEIRVKEEPPTGDQDPIAPDTEEYTVVVKEEFEADDETSLIALAANTTDTAQIKVTLPSLVCSRNVAASSSSLPSAMSGPPLMTVVADEMQLFANSLAEQLRAFPLDRALLLQLEIQTMVDNERQLLFH